jgi:hypothetical protein
MQCSWFLLNYNNKNEKLKIGLGYACALLVISNLKVTISFIDLKNLNMGDFD